MIICVDFDGTIVEHEFPDIGAPVPGAIEWMRRWQEAGARLVLWTMRSDGRADDGSPENGPVLSAAVDYCRSRGVEFWGVNRNPEQGNWTQSPKAYANLYVDDAAFGCPLTPNEKRNGRPTADWSIIGPAVLARIVAKRS